MPFLTFAQQTYVPDDYFEAYLESNGMGNGIPNDDFVTTANIATVTHLNISNQNIVDETGIEDFVSLSTLQCGDNMIDSLILNNPNLDTLICNYNNMNYLDITQCSALIYLNCQGNNYYSEINLSGNLELSYLNCAGSQIDSLQVSQNHKLEFLNCEANPMVYLNVSGADSLKYLNCRFCWLPYVDVSTNLKLDYLNLFNTEITALDLTNNINLTHLDVQLNELTSLNISQNILLDTLICSSNNIIDIDVSNNSALKYLNCAGNNLTILDVTQNLALVGLVCSANQISELILSNNPSIVYLNCYNNDLYCLNLKNGNNQIFIEISPNSNPHLTCIEVDDPAFSAANWYTNGGLESQMYYSTYCNNNCTTGLDELTSEPKQLTKIIDLIGRKTEEKSNTTLIYMYSDGSIEKVYRIE